MQVRRIATEDANAEQWRMLLHFSYEPNIRRFLEARGHTPTSELGEFIAGSLRQGQAYFAAAQNAPLDISPLLLYYGLTNLMVSVAALTTGATLKIKSHGMRIEVPQAVRNVGEVASETAGSVETQTDERIDPSGGAQSGHASDSNAKGVMPDDEDSVGLPNDEDVTPQDYIPTGLGALRVVPHSPNDGGLNLLARVFSPGTTFRMNHSWTLQELLGSVPDLRDEYIACYPDAACYVLPVELTRRRYATFERIDLAHVKSFGRLFSGIERIESFLRMIEGYDDAYLPPQRAHGFVPLRRKLGGRDIGFYGMFGQKFLALPHVVDRNPNAQVSLDKMHTASPLMVLLMSLYALGFVSRYCPELWNPFVRNDTTGEKMVVERLLFIAGRYAPNLVLNVIHDERLSFVPPTQDLGDMLEERARTDKGIRDGRASVGNHAPLVWSESELQTWVKDIIHDVLRRLERNR